MTITFSRICLLLNRVYELLILPTRTINIFSAGKESVIVVQWSIFYGKIIFLLHRQTLGKVSGKIKILCYTDSDPTTTNPPPVSGY